MLIFMILILNFFALYRFTIFDQKLFSIIYLRSLKENIIFSFYGNITHISRHFFINIFLLALTVTFYRLLMHFNRINGYIRLLLLLGFVIFNETLIIMLLVSIKIKNKSPLSYWCLNYFFLRSELSWISIDSFFYFVINFICFELVIVKL